MLWLLDLLFYFDSSLKLSNEDRLNTIKEEYRLDSEILKEVLGSMSDLMTGVQFYAQEYSNRENASLQAKYDTLATNYDTLATSYKTSQTEVKDLKNENRDLKNILKSHGIKFKSDGDDEDGDEE